MDKDQKPKSCEEETEEELLTERRADQDQQIVKTGSVTPAGGKYVIHCLTIIGQIEGHYILPSQNKTTKYEHVLPQLAAIEDDPDIEGLLILINTVGGDISAGLALAEMIASLSCPTVSLVLGDSHSIGVPLAVSTDYSLIVPTGTMIIHPVRMTGMVIGAPQTYDYFKLMQERILSFIAGHCRTPKEKLEAMMLNTGMLTKDLGTILVGAEAVEQGLIDQVGGIREALAKLYGMIGETGSSGRKGTGEKQA